LGRSVIETQAYGLLAEVVIVTESRLLASPYHSAAYVSSDPVPQRGQVRVLGTDNDGGWLLVLHGDRLGWIPKFYSGTGMSSLVPAVVIRPMEAECRTYVGSCTLPDEEWASRVLGSVVVQGILYRPEPAEGSEEVSLAVEIDGPGEIVSSDTYQATAPGSAQVHFFTLVLGDLDTESRIRIGLDGVEREPVSFLASFFSDDCSGAQVAYAPEDVPPAGGEGLLPTASAHSTGATQGQTPTPVVIRIVLGPQKPVGPVPTDIREAVTAVLEKFETLRIRCHGPSHDVTGLDTVLAEKRLSEQLSAVKWQRDNNAYYVISVHESHVVEMTLTSSTQVQVLVDKLESREFYIDGRLGTKNTVYDDHYQVRYFLKRMAGGWFIVDREVVEDAAMTTPTPAKGSAATPVPKKSTPAGPKPIASSIRDFTGTQGANGWKYLAERGRNSGHWDKEMWFGDYGGGKCWLTDEAHVRICGNGTVHPGWSTRVAYEWRTSETRQVQVSVHAHKEDAHCGDGVKISTWKAVDGQGMVQQLGEFRISYNDTKGKTQTYQVGVGPGILVYVIVDIYGESTCDASKVTVEIF
jgi:hypothetical protein